jgi:acetylornithine/N-succinyldiaminopimelate aminotransferase
VAQVHERLAAELVATSHGVVSHVRGRGLLMAAVLSTAVAGGLERAARGRGLIVNAVGPDAIRFAPALTISDDDVAAALQRWELSCADVARSLVPS